MIRSKGSRLWMLGIALVVQRGVTAQTPARPALELVEYAWFALG